MKFCRGPTSVPTGEFELVLATTLRMSSSEMLRCGGGYRIDLDAHREPLRAVHQHLRDAGQLRNLLRQHQLGVVVDRRQRQRLRVQAEEQDRENRRD